VLQKRVCNYRFASPQTEIVFFKTCKPLFTAEILYHNYAYCALLFQPVQTREALSFWTREKERLQVFIRRNQGFYDYLTEGEGHLDHLYFLREHLTGTSFASAKVYDNDPRALTNKDPFVATLLALEKYQAFADACLSQLGGPV